MSLLVTVGCNWPGKPDPAQRPVPADKVLDFPALFSENCSGCHGAEGKMGPAPPLNDPLFLSIIPDDKLLSTIREGRHGTPMPAFVKEQGGTLTGDQVAAIAQGIKSTWGKKLPPAKAPPPPYLPPSGSSERDRSRVERGTMVFMRACSICHGENGNGLKDEGQVSLRINDPTFLALISDQALRRFAITGRPDLGMPNYAEKRPDDPDFKPLTAADIDDVVALMSSWRPQPPGHVKHRPAGPAGGSEPRRSK